MEKSTELVQFLQQLSDKLGTTTEYLWAVLIKQQYVHAYSTLFMSGVLAIVLLLNCILLPREIRKISNEKDYSFDLCSNQQFIWNIFFSLMFLLGLIIICLLLTGIKILCNPEYYALKEIL